MAARITRAAFRIKTKFSTYRRLFPALGTKSYQCQTNGFSFELRSPRGRPSQRHRAGQIKVDQLSALRTNRMIMSSSLAIVAAGAVSESDFLQEPRIF